MTRLTFTGKRNGKDISIIWEDGALTGDDGLDGAVLDWIEQYARAMDGHTVGPIGGPYSTTDHLADPYAASEIIKSMFPGSVQVEGELPYRVAPDGAIQ